MKTLALLMALVLFASTNLFAQYPAEEDQRMSFHYQPQPDEELKLIDVEGLAAIDFTKKIGRNFKLNANFQTRYYDDVSRYKASLLEISTQYDFNPYVSIKSGVRFGHLSGPSYGGIRYYEKQVRFANSITFKLKRKGFPFEVHARLRHEKEAGSVYLTNYTFFRQRIKVKYKGLKFATVYASCEPFRTSLRNDFTKLIRYEGGIDWKLSNHSKLRTFYRLEQILYPDVDIHVIGLSWGLKY